MEKNKNAVRVVTPEFRVSFPSVYEAKAFSDDQKAKFSVQMLFPKKTDISELKKAVKAACVAKWGDQIPKNLREPFKDGNEKSDLDGYANHIVVSASNQYRPNVVDRTKHPITQESGDFYAGCYARAALVAYAYGGGGNKKIRPGVSFSLENIQKLRDGEPFGGGRSAEDDFEDLGELVGESNGEDFE